MRIVKHKLSDSDLDKLVNYLIEHLNFSYENHSSDMSIISSEQQYLWSKGYQHNMIVAKKNKSAILIDIIVVSSDQLFYSFKASSHKKYILSVEKVLHEYAKRFDLTLEDE
jgi:hypothetical protein